MAGGEIKRRELTGDEVADAFRALGAAFVELGRGLGEALDKLTDPMGEQMKVRKVESERVDE